MFLIYFLKKIFVKKKMTPLSSLAKTLLLNHVSRFHSSSSPIGRRSLFFSYIGETI
jgi:hypothetical protein